MVYYKQNIRNFAYEHYCNSNDITIAGDNKVQRCPNAGLEQAVLINIVAAVNDEAHDDASLDTRDNSSVVDSLSSQFTVISTPRERTVSIPNSPVSLNMPTGTIGQKKPVYYKHSEFEVKKNKLTNIYGGSLNNGNRLTKLNRPSVKKQTLDKPKPVLIEKIVKKIPATTPILEEINGVKGKHDTVRKSQSTSWSPVRRLGALKKTNSRTLHETSKCDMIDIKVANDVIARNKAKTTDASTKRSRVFEKHTKTLSPPPAAKTHPFYRSKSLPVVLPVKTNKSISPQRYHSRIIKNTPMTRHGKESGAYGIIRHVTTGYKLDELTLNNSFSHDPSKVIAISREVRLHTPNTSTPRLSLKHRQRWQSTWSNGSVCNDKCSTTTATSTLYNDNFSRTDTNNSALFKDNCSMTVTSNCTELEQQQEDKTITPVNTKEPVEEVKLALNGRTSSNEQLVSEKHNEDVSKGDDLKTHAILSEKQASGILNKTSSLTDAFSERKSEKRVQFAGNHTRCTSDNGGGDNDRIIPNITGYGDSSMTQARAYTSRTSYSGIQPLTSQELLRLKQKYIPTNVRNSLENHPSLNFTNTSAMKIQGFSRPASELSGRTVSFSVSDSEDNDSVGDIEGSIDDVDISTSYSDDEDTESESEDEETDDDVTVIPDETNKTTEKPPPRKKRAKYKFVKAVDLDSYTGFEHKKLRNVYKGPFVSRSSDDPLGNFVKVKVRDVYL